MLVLEDLFGSCGISSLLWRVPRWSKLLGYPALPVFLELFLQMPKYKRICTAAEDLTEWYEQCQELYDQNIAAQRATFLYRKQPSPEFKDVFQEVSYPLIPTSHLREYMSNGDTVVSINSVCLENSLAHTGTCSSHAYR